MSITITITAHPEFGDEAEQVRASMAAINYAPLGTETAAQMFARHTTDMPKGEPLVNEDGTAPASEPTTTAPASEPTTTAPKRERGRPSPGKARRTKAEIAEDEAADAAEAATSETEMVQTEQLVAEDDAATQTQDAADEQAEVNAARDPDKPVTVDDVKNAYLPYFNKHGLEATKEDGAKLFVSVLGSPPEGANGWTTAAILEQGQAKAQAVIDAWAAAAAAPNRFGA